LVFIVISPLTRSLDGFVGSAPQSRRHSSERSLGWNPEKPDGWAKFPTRLPIDVKMSTKRTFPTNLVGFNELIDVRAKKSASCIHLK